MHIPRKRRTGVVDITNPNDKEEARIQKNISYYQQLNAEWLEIPVDIDTFISHPDYLGKITKGGTTIYETWKVALRKIFNDPSKYIIIFSGCIGSGKSYIASIAVLYIQYLLMCKKDPWGAVQKSDSGQFTISFFNLKKSMSDSVGYRRIQTLISQSPWFRNRAAKIYQGVQEELKFSLFNYTLSSPYSQGFGIQGAEVITGILDEVDSPTAPIRQKERVLQAYQSTMARFRNRFVHNEVSIGKLFVVSSKQDNMGFIDTFIAERSGKSDTLLFDFALWEVLPKHTYCGKVFQVSVPRDTFHMPKILADNESPEKYREEGSEVIDVPIEYRRQFDENLIIAIRDFAGKTMHSSRRNKLFKSEQFVRDCFDKTKKDPMNMETIELGMKDQVDLTWYMDLAKIRVPLSVPRYMHMDFGLTHDALVLACSCSRGYEERDVEQPDGTFQKQRAMVIETDFIMRIKARDGESIPIAAVRKFVIDLKRIGLNIRKVTADLNIATADFRQILEKAGIPTDYLSVDKTDLQYLTWRDMVYDKRWVCHPHTILLFEAKHLEHDQAKGKVNHPTKVDDIEFTEEGEARQFIAEGSKDVTDAVVGSVFTCLEGSGVSVDMTSAADILRRTVLSDRPIEHDMTNRLLGLPSGPPPTKPGEQKELNKVDILRRLL